VTEVSGGGAMVTEGDFDPGICCAVARLAIIPIQNPKLHKHLCFIFQS